MKRKDKIKMSLRGKSWQEIVNMLTSFKNQGIDCEIKCTNSTMHLIKGSLYQIFKDGRIRFGGKNGVEEVVI